MNKIIVGITAGTVAVVIPMILRKISWDANILAFSMWVICVFLTATTDLKIHPIVKGVLISFLVLIPSVILIGWEEPFNLIPISAMTVVLGSLSGFIINKIDVMKSNKP